MMNIAHFEYTLPKLYCISRYPLIVIAITAITCIPLKAEAQNKSALLETYEEAVALYHKEEAQAAREKFSRLEPDICRAEELIEECVDVYLYQSIMYRNERDFENTEAFIDKAYEAVQDRLGENHYKLIEVYVNYSFLHESQSNLEEALDWSRKAVELAKRYPEEKIITSQAYTNYGYVEDTAGEYERAIEHFDTALEILEEAEPGFELNRALSITHNNAGISHRKMGNFEDAKYHFEQALTAAKEAYEDGHTEIALIYNGIGTYYYSIRDLGTATEYFKQTAAAFEEVGERKSDRLARVYNNIGLIYVMMGDLDNGLKYLEQSQEIKIELYGTEHLDTAVGYHNLASHYLANNQYEEAEENYFRSLNIRRKIYGENHPNLLLPYTNIANLYIQTKQYNEAEIQLKKALDIGLSRLGENHPEVFPIYAQLGEIQQEKGLLSESEEFYRKTISILIGRTYTPMETSVDVSDINYPVQFVEVNRSFGELKLKQYEADNNSDHLHEALRLFNFAVGGIDVLQTQYQSESSKLELIDSQYSIFSSAADAYYELYKISGDERWIAEMLSFMEKGRSRIAVELMQNVQAKNFGGVPDEILEEERKINERVSNHFQELNVEQEKGLEADTGLIRNHEDSLFTSRRELIQFTERLEEEYPSYYELKYDRSTATLNDIQTMLNANESALYYVFGEENLYTIIINPNSVSVVESGKSEQIKEQVDDLRRAVIAGEKESYTENASTLYSSLVLPAKSEIEGEGLLIFPDQTLHYLPFELLLEENSADMDYHKMPYLIKTHPIQYAPSATVLRAMINQKPEKPRNLLALAPFNEAMTRFGNNEPVESDETRRFFNELTPLPLTSYETNKISELFSRKRNLIDYVFPEQVSVYQNREAQTSRLKVPSAANYNFIHIASHAFVNESNPELSGILLRDDDGEEEILYVSDIYNLQLNADLVVLGACETGLGEVHKGEGMIGFTRAFTYAGASNLMVSMWRVNDQNTAKLMIDFYDHVRQDSSYQKALQRAKVKLIENPETAHPIHWAAFVLSGR